jgi:hypothetical protein
MMLGAADRELRRAVCFATDVTNTLSIVDKEKLAPMLESIEGSIAKLHALIVGGAAP